MNASDIKIKLSAGGNRANRLMRAEMTDPKRIREVYVAAFSREPTADELRSCESYLLKPRTDAQGNPMDSFRAKHLGYEDLIWAVLNTKEFLYNH
jgi:hypothetical protein